MTRLVYEIDGDHVVIDQEKKAELDMFAARVAKRLGWEALEGMDFSKSVHPLAATAWGIAVEAYYCQVAYGTFD